MQQWLNNVTRAQKASQFGTDYNDTLKSENRTDFKGYTRDEMSSTVVELFNNESSVNTLEAGEAGIVILDQTPFYAESGGQVGDTGTLQFDNGTFEVTDTVKAWHMRLRIKVLLIKP